MSAWMSENRSKGVDDSRGLLHRNGFMPCVRQQSCCAAVSRGQVSTRAIIKFYRAVSLSRTSWCLLGNLNNLIHSKLVFSETFLMSQPIYTVGIVCLRCCSEARPLVARTRIYSGT